MGLGLHMIEQCLLYVGETPSSNIDKCDFNGTINKISTLSVITLQSILCHSMTQMQSGGHGHNYNGVSRSPHSCIPEILLPNYMLLNVLGPS